MTFKESLNWDIYEHQRVIFFLTDEKSGRYETSKKPV